MSGESDTLRVARSLERSAHKDKVFARKQEKGGRVGAFPPARDDAMTGELRTDGSCPWSAQVSAQSSCSSRIRWGISSSGPPCEMRLEPKQGQCWCDPMAKLASPAIPRSAPWSQERPAIPSAPPQSDGGTGIGLARVRGMTPTASCVKRRQEPLGHTSVSLRGQPYWPLCPGECPGHRARWLPPAASRWEHPNIKHQRCAPHPPSALTTGMINCMLLSQLGTPLRISGISV